MIPVINRFIEPQPRAQPVRVESRPQNIVAAAKRDHQTLQTIH